MTDSKTLLAYYDLSLSPISFDFVVFAMNAEISRNQLGLDIIHFVIVPGWAGGFREDDSEYDVDNKNWRLTNIITPICRLMPCPVSVSTCQTREEAKSIGRSKDDAVFPEGYSVDAPIARFGWSQIVSAVVSGQSAPSLTAGRQAMTYMKEWIEAHTNGRKPVSITLRESSHLSRRNSNVDDWLAFAKSINNDKFAPIVVRDTEKVFEQDSRFDDVILCPLAAVNLELRMALYELCWINTMILNGPAELCRLNERTRYLIFKMVVPEVDNASPIYMVSQGFKPGGQLPHAHQFQRQIWEEDELEIIAREFENLHNDLMSAKEAVLSPSRIEAEEPAIDVAVRLQMTGRLEEATEIFQKIVKDDPLNPDAWHMLGIIAHQAGQHEPSERMLVRAIQLRPEQSNYYISLASLQKDTGRNDDAIRSLRSSIQITPDDAGAHADLSDLLSVAGDTVGAENEMLEALKLSPDSVELYERAAKLLETHGNSLEALNFYRRAVELRSEHARRAAEAAANMPEVPKITLSQG